VPRFIISVFLICEVAALFRDGDAPFTTNPGIADAILPIRPLTVVIALDFTEVAMPKFNFLRKSFTAGIRLPSSSDAALRTSPAADSSRKGKKVQE